MPLKGSRHGERAENRAETTGKSGRRRQIIGILYIRDDFVRFPYRARRDRAQADGPVGPARAGRADDVEFDAAAHPMPLQGIKHPDLEFIDCRRGFCKKRLEIHLASPSLSGGPAVAADHPVGLLLGLPWLTAR